MLRAYYDNLNLIRIESNKENEKYYIWDKEIISELVLQKKFPLDGIYIYEYKPLIELFDQKDYYVYSETGNYAPLQVRNYVRSEHFNNNYFYEGKLGAIYSPKETIFRIWSPTSSDVLLKLMNRTQNIFETVSMVREETGIYEITIEEDLEGYSYVFVVKNQGQWKETVDPYAKSSKANSIESYIINPNKVNANYSNFTNQNLPITSAVIYEIHVRDFSIDKNVNFNYPGKFLAFTETGLTNKEGEKIGLDYLKDLGITHVQLMPINDFSSITEFEFDRAYNWGYDPEQFQVVEGRYVANADDPYRRILDLKRTVEILHQNNIGVIVDVVFNHVYNRDNFSFEKLVPGFFYRKDENNNYSNGTGVGNDIATERKMIRKYIVDTLIYWMTEFNLQGFRFDLMGVMDIETLLTIKRELRKINPNVYLYGEGWDLPTLLAKEKKATIENASKLEDIGFFNPTFRDVIKGSTFDIHEKGLASGNLNLIGGSTNLLTGSVTYMFQEPNQTINYVSCHDNHTLYDRLKLSCPGDITAYQKLSLAFVLLAQGVSFLHAGSEFGRTKNGVENSYNYPDEINKIDWQLVSENKNLVNFVKNLIKVRKENYSFHFATKEEINKNVQVQHDGQVIEYKLQGVDGITPFNDYLVIFNLSSYEQQRNLDEEMRYINLEGEELEIGEKTNVTIIKPYSVQLFIK